MRSILVIGGGLAGTETALTLARTLPGDSVTLVTPWPRLRLVPNLVYVPFGIPGNQVDAPLGRMLESAGITVRDGSCTQVDPDSRIATLADGTTIPYDVLVACPGTTPAETDGLRLRTLEDAARIGETLAALDPQERPTILVRILGESTWSAPGVEFAQLAGAWVQARGWQDRVTVSLATSDRHAFPLFNIDAEDAVDAQLAHLGVEVAAGIPAGRIESLTGTVTIDFGWFTARTIDGLPRLDATGFHGVDAGGRIGIPDHYVVGDAASILFKSAFSAGWQARRVARSLDGDLSLLGPEVGGVPSEQCEYQMDMGDRTMVVRWPSAETLATPYDSMRATVDVVEGAPDKLRGLIVHDLLASGPDMAPAATFHTALEQLHQAGPAGR